MVPKFHKPNILDILQRVLNRLLNNCLLSGVLTLVDNKLMRMDNYKFKFKGTSGYWIVKNKDAVTSKLNYLKDVRQMGRGVVLKFRTFPDGGRGGGL